MKSLTGVEPVEPVERVPNSAHACVYGPITGKPSTPSTPSTPALSDSLSALSQAEVYCQPLPIADYERATRAAIGRRSRRKGKTWERELAALLRPVFGAHVKRGFQSRCGRDGCDVEGTPFWLEAKHGKLVNVRAALRQALEATDGRPAVVVAKDDRRAPLVVMRLEDWLSIAARARPELPASARPTTEEST